MSTNYNIPTLLTGIARTLGHAMCPSKDEPDNIVEWHQAAERRLEERIQEQERQERMWGVTTPYPTAYWVLSSPDGEPTIQYATASGRLEIVATDAELDLLLFAGPDLGRYLPAGTFRRRADGAYDWVGDGIADPGDSVTIEFERDHEFARARGISRPGRLIVCVTVSRSAVTVEWADKSLLDNRPDRADLLIKIDNRVFGGAIVAADSSGRLSRARDELRALREAEDMMW